MGTQQQQHIVSEKIFLSSFLFFFPFWFPLQPINMSSEPKYTRLTENFARNISTKVLLKYLQWLLSGRNRLNFQDRSSEGVSDQ